MHSGNKINEIYIYRIIEKEKREKEEREEREKDKAWEREKVKK